MYSSQNRGGRKSLKIPILTSFFIPSVTQFAKNAATPKEKNVQSDIGRNRASRLEVDRECMTVNPYLTACTADC